MIDPLDLFSPYIPSDEESVRLEDILDLSDPLIASLLGRSVRPTHILADGDKVADVLIRHSGPPRPRTDNWTEVPI